jgi:hypothetical protein
MKMKMQKLFITLIGIIFIGVSCTRDAVVANTSTTLQSGTWRVTNFNESGVDHTSYFVGYVFDFNTNGTVVAVKDRTVVNGTWVDGNDNSTPKLILNFGTVSNFNELNEDWEILEKTATKIRLKHVSGGNGTTDLLTFEKI